MDGQAPPARRSCSGASALPADALCDAAAVHDAVGLPESRSELDPNNESVAGSSGSQPTRSPQPGTDRQRCGHPSRVRSDQGQGTGLTTPPSSAGPDTRQRSSETPCRWSFAATDRPQPDPVPPLHRGDRRSSGSATSCARWSPCPSGPAGQHRDRSTVITSKQGGRECPAHRETRGGTPTATTPSSIGIGTGAAGRPGVIRWTRRHQHRQHRRYSGPVQPNGRPRSWSQHPGQRRSGSPCGCGSWDH